MTIDKLFIADIAIDVEQAAVEGLLARGVPATVFAEGCKLPAMLNRRLSVGGKRAAALANQLLQGERLPIVWCSQYGDLPRTQRLMESIVRGESMSPTDFSLSVQNAEPGILSIATENHSPIVAISCAKRRFYNALLECELQRRESGTDVILVMTDQLIPDVYRMASDFVINPTVLVLRLSASGAELSLGRAALLDDQASYDSIFTLLIESMGWAA